MSPRAASFRFPEIGPGSLLEAARSGARLSFPSIRLTHFEKSTERELSSGLGRGASGWARRFGMVAAWIATTAVGSVVAAHLLFGPRPSEANAGLPSVIRVVETREVAALPAACPAAAWQPPVVAVEDLPRAPPPRASSVFALHAMARRPMASAARLRAAPGPRMVPASVPAHASPPTLEEFMRRAVESDRGATATLSR